MELGEHGADGREVAVIAHHAHQDQVRSFFLGHGRQCLGQSERVGAVDLWILHVNGAVGTHPEGGAQGLGHTVWTDRDHHHFRLPRILGAESLLERIGVIRVDFEFDVVFRDPRAIRIHVEPCILVRHLFQADQYLHGGTSLRVFEKR